MAEKLEAAGNTNDLTLIHQETDNLLRIYRGYRCLLQPYITSITKQEEVAPKSTVDHDTIQTCFKELLIALKDFNIDQAETLITQLNGYELDSETTQLVTTIGQAVTDFDYDQGITLLEPHV